VINFNILLITKLTNVSSLFTITLNKQRTPPAHPPLPRLNQHPLLLLNHNPHVVAVAEAPHLVLDATTSVAVLPPPPLPLLKTSLLPKESSLGEVSLIHFLLNSHLIYQQPTVREGKAAEIAVVEAVVAVAVVHSTSTARQARRESLPLSISFFPPHIPNSDSDKKVHNSWGGDDGETERKVEEAATIDAAVENANSGGLNDWANPSGEGAAADDAWGAPPAADDATPADGAEKDKRERRGDKEEEEEDNTLTLDQYLAQQREKENSLVPKLEVRKPNEGVEDDLFNGAAPSKKDEEEYFSGKVHFFLSLFISAVPNPSLD